MDVVAMVDGNGRTCISATNNSLTPISVPDQRSSLSPENVEPLWLPLSSASFHGPKTMMNFEIMTGGPNPADAPTPFLLQQPETKVENMEEDHINDCLFLQPAGKKRRLSPNQVHFLEKIFEEENKLEPERKAQLAKELGLHPRQVAIWFQNRRARYKTKQLEKEYGALKASYDNLKVDCDNLVKANEELEQEVRSLKERLHTRVKEDHISHLIEVINSSNIKNQKPIVKELAETISNVPTLECKPETASSTRSDVLDSDSPWIEPANSSHFCEPDYSDFSQDETDDLSKKYLPLQFPPRLEADRETADSFKFGFLHEDRHFWTWP